MREIYLTYLSRPDIEAAALADDEILAAIEAALAMQGRGETVIEPRVHLEPRSGTEGHFNVLRGFAGGEIGMAGVKVVGDFVGNYAHGLPSELGLLCLFDPGTGAPVAVIDASGITEMRTGAVTAVGASTWRRRGPGRWATSGRAGPPTGMCGCWTGCSASRRSGCTPAAPKAGTGSPPA
jgi:ornithine cyclodeaminase